MGSAENNRSELEKNCCMFPGTLLMIIPSPNVYIPCQCVGALPPRRGALGGGVSYFKRTRFLVQRNCDHKAVRILGDGASRGIHIPLHLCFRRTSDEGRPRIAALDVTVVTIKKALRPHTMRVLA